MRERLVAGLTPTRLEIVDESHKHVGHAGARDGRGHFAVEIESAAFAGKTSIAMHRLVYAALGEMMQTDIHALSIKASAPESAE
jgi:BolA protein